MPSKRKRNTAEDEILRSKEREDLINRPRGAVHGQMKKMIARYHRLVKRAKGNMLPHEHEREMRLREAEQQRQAQGHKDEQEAKVTQLSHDLAKLRRDTAAAQMDLDREHHKKEVLRMQNSKKQAAYTAFIRNMSTLRNELTENKLSADNDNKEAEKFEGQVVAGGDLSASLERELERAIAARNAAIEDAARAETERRNAQDDYDLLIAKSSAENEELAEQLAALERTPAELEAALRKAFQEQLLKIIEERKRQFHEANAQGVSELKRRYARKWAEYEEQLAGVKNTNDDLKNQLARVNAQIAEAKTINAPAARLAAAIKKCNTLQDDITRANDRWSRNAQRNKNKLESLRATRNKKDREYDDLMDLKVALAMEIKAYSGLLENEEDRLGYVSPVKRARERILEEIRSSSHMEESD